MRKNGKKKRRKGLEGSRRRKIGTQESFSATNKRFKLTTRFISLLVLSFNFIVQKYFTTGLKMDHRNWGNQH